MLRLDLSGPLHAVSRAPDGVWRGRVVQLTGLLIESEGPAVAVGDFCEVQVFLGRTIRTQVIGFRDGRVLSMPLEETDGLQLGDVIVARSEQARITVGPGLLGRGLDALGRPLDGAPPLQSDISYKLY